MCEALPKALESTAVDGARTASSLIEEVDQGFELSVFGGCLLQATFACLIAVEGADCLEPVLASNATKYQQSDKQLCVHGFGPATSVITVTH